MTDKLVALEAELRAAEAEFLGLPKDGPSERTEAVGARQCAAIKAVAITPAETLEGVAIKLRYVVDGFENERGWEPELAQTALESVERLLAGGRQ